MDKISYEQPQPLKECIMKAKWLYEQGNNMQDLHKNLKRKLRMKYEQRKEVFRTLETKQDQFNNFRNPFQRCNKE